MSKKSKLEKQIEIEEKLTGKKVFYKENKKDKIWWVDTYGVCGLLEISFDKKNILNLWTDYPQKFTKEEKELFDKENPYWADFFRDRCLEEKIDEIK